MKPSTFNLQHRGTIGKSVGKLRVNDAMSDFIVCRAHDHVLYFRYFLKFDLEMGVLFAFGREFTGKLASKIGKYLQDHRYISCWSCSWKMVNWLLGENLLVVPGWNIILIIFKCSMSLLVNTSCNGVICNTFFWSVFLKISSF